VCDSRVAHVDEPFGAALTFGYDAAGNRTSVLDSGGGVTTITFDAVNQQTSEEFGGPGLTRVKDTRKVTGNGGLRFDYAHTARGDVASLTRYSDLAGTSVVGTTAYQYDAGRG